MYRISVDNHSMEIVETDGTAVYGPTIHEIPISSGERYSVIINTTEGKEGDAFWLRTSVALDCMAQGVTQVGLAVVRYTGNGSITTAEPRTEAWRVIKKPMVEILADNIFRTDLARPDTPCVGLDEMYHLSPRERVNASQTALESRVLDSKLGKFVDVYGNSFEGYGFNNVTYQNQINDPLLYVVQRGGTCNSSLIANATFADIGPVNIIINNLDSHIGHPYHMHGTEFQLMGRGTGALTLDDLPNTNLTLDNPTRKDTIWMQGGSWALLRIISDNPGVWALHCHIGWHLAKGKMAVVVIQPEAIKKIQWPESWMDVKGAVVELQITHANGNRGNGLRVRGSSVLQFVDYDLKVYSLGDQGARSTLMAPPPKAKLAISVWTGELDGSRRLRKMWRRGRRGYWSCIPTASPVNRWIDESEYSSGREDELAKGKPEDAFQGMQRKDQRGVSEGVGPDVSDLEEQ
ncbi:hypothetical protein C367_04541 [Cryptococcus neoformans Ze90-1]|nr:hypothetical protein C367_04541 [Cryptococcus neoformans var. grubii Ze90-1]